ncbi:hypothetical protein BRW65_11730 [Mycobacterium paraffinicum]|uniref:Uncharacterized protein n=1 Tax=Mycobacterium paraffinicum TaxID=53378 RepID=A0A1Q4HVB4_9MYCO|nr:hypothetical protein BRW65_11730 [Mycobacterium paraffinicum]
MHARYASTISRTTGALRAGFLNNSIAPTCVVPAGDSISSHERSSGGIDLVMAHLQSGATLVARESEYYGDVLSASHGRRGP